MFESMNEVCRIRIPYPHWASIASTNDRTSIVNEENGDYTTNASSIEHPALNGKSLEIIYVESVGQVWDREKTVIGWNTAASPGKWIR